jgi:hypothetical protein
MDFKNLKKKIREPKVSRLLPNLCDLHKKSIGQGMDLKIYRKSIGCLWIFILCDSHLSTTRLGISLGRQLSGELGNE